MQVAFFITSSHNLYNFIGQSDKQKQELEQSKEKRDMKQRELQEAGNLSFYKKEKKIGLSMQILFSCQQYLKFQIQFYSIQFFYFQRQINKNLFKKNKTQAYRLMDQGNTILIYIRRTNGAGEKIKISSVTTTQALYQHVSRAFNLSRQAFELFFRGFKLLDSRDVNISDLKIQSQSIVHVVENMAVNNEQILNAKIEIRIFCKNSLYSYQAYKKSMFIDLKTEVATLFLCNPLDIMIVYLGRTMDDTDTFANQGIKDQDLISVIVNPIPLQKRGASRFKPKIAQSLTFAPTQESDPSYEPFANTLLRKSSMKSSHQSRQFNSCFEKKSLQTIRPRSQLTRSNHMQQNEQNAQSNLQLNKLPWLSSQKMIQTQSINFDDPEEQQDPQDWVQCIIQLHNQQNSEFFAIECNQNHKIESIINRLNKFRKGQMVRQLIFADENSQQIAESNQAILSIAKKNKTKIIHEVIFK